MFAISAAIYFFRFSQILPLAVRSLNWTQFCSFNVTTRSSENYLKTPAFSQNDNIKHCDQNLKKASVIT